MAEELILTREGYTKIEQEHEYLVSVRRKEVAERIKEAISYGDISENSEFDSAKNEQAELEERILKLENMMRNATVIEDDDINLEVANVGLTIKVKDLDFDEDIEFSIVGSSEIDPSKNLISNESPIGKELMGKRVGDIIEVTVPDGSVIKFEVLEIYKK
ncbi:MAG: transcription elongation factor GreA [Firmicutes bacterium]|nr:transcription elongation factor GreA [Bacillota bacterium]